jgi:hypothetical protein
VFGGVNVVELVEVSVVDVVAEVVNVRLVVEPVVFVVAVLFEEYVLV